MCCCSSLKVFVCKGTKISLTTVVLKKNELATRTKHSPASLSLCNAVAAGRGGWGHMSTLFSKFSFFSFRIFKVYFEKVIICFISLKNLLTVCSKLFISSMMYKLAVSKFVATRYMCRTIGHRWNNPPMLVDITSITTITNKLAVKPIADLPQFREKNVCKHSLFRLLHFVNFCSPKCRKCHFRVLRNAKFPGPSYKSVVTAILPPRWKIVPTALLWVYEMAGFAQHLWSLLLRKISPSWPD